eukprot:TRINITY_DN1574_c0_g1_i2.p1 TRINITY_DN1574_c0_g1~~TRINITY_DN1574_c0_g1_i2.p1  ORF type:complete len:309 (+),score=76.60 TRINITY_DN1574_c0_g1_i2:48-929(+)
MTESKEEDLDAILFSTLAEYEKQTSTTPNEAITPTINTAASTVAATSAAEASKDNTSRSTNATSEDEILESALAEEFCRTMKEFIELSGDGNVDELTKTLLQFTEDKNRNLDPSSSSSSSSSSGLQNGLSNTLKMLYETKDQISKLEEEVGDAGEDAILNKLLDQLENSSEFGGVMENVMKQLLSKEVIQEPLEKLKEQYPEWLERNKGQIEKAEYDRFEKQYKYICNICDLFQNEPENFDAIVSALQQVQECGQPPKEIINELAPGVEFNSDGTPKLNTTGSLPGQPPCPVM